MTRPAFVLCALSLVVAGIYLFVNAPPALPETSAEPGSTIPIEAVLATVAAENDIARALYTREIVTAGQAAGLRFQEEWLEPGIDAGPLPALLLREAAASLQRGPLPLGLFLGSDFPISPANRFAGRQTAAFETIKRTRRPEFFYAEDTGQYTAMFPDVAGVQGCVTCHNEHKDSPKTDWVLDDVMGATTWTYDKAAVTPEEYLRIIGAVRQSFRDAYAKYLEKVPSFEKQPEIGDRWPAEGYFLPSADVFMAEFARRASASTVDRLLTGPDAATSDAGR
jgi:adenylate cyclase